MPSNKYFFLLHERAVVAVAVPEHQVVAEIVMTIVIAPLQAAVFAPVVELTRELLYIILAIHSFLVRN